MMKNKNGSPRYVSTRVAPSRSRWLGRITLFVLALMLFPGIAFAAGGQTALQNFTDQVMAILIPTFVLIIGALATWLLTFVQKRLHIEVSDKIKEQWNDLARQAALRGAEWARKKAKELAGDKKIPGGDIMEVAANWAIDMAVAQGLPALAREKLEGLIEAELFKLRLETSPTAGQVIAATAASPTAVTNAAVIKAELPRL